MKRYLLAAVMLSGCMWGAFANLLAPSDHNCACYPDKTTKQWFMCDANGQRKAEGPYMCCGGTRADGTICGKKCMRMNGEEEHEHEEEAAPPFPVPLPPRCDLATHCKTKESCIVGDHECCSACHQACL